MTGYLSLMKLALRNRLAVLRAGTWRKADGKVDAGKVAQGVALVLLAVVLLGGVVVIEFLLFRVLATVGQQWLLPALALLMTMIGTVMLGFFQILAQLYFDKDVQLMAYLPVRSETVLMAKTTEIYVSELGMSALILLPSFILCGVHAGAGLGYWLTAAMVTLAAPVLPMALMMLLSTGLARISSFVRHKDALMMACTLVLVFIVMGLEMTVTSRIPEDADAAFFLRLILDREALLNQVVGALPPARWAIEALRGQASSLLLLIGTSLTAIGLTMALVGPRYLSIALNQQEKGGRRNALRMDKISYSASSQVMSLYRLEMRTLLRTPVYAFNGVYGSLVMPLVMAFMLVMSQTTGEMAEIAAMIPKFRQMISIPDQALIVAALMSLCSFMNPAAATAVSREGKRFAHTRTLPVAPRTLLQAKLLMGLTTSSLSCIAGGVIAGVFLRANGWLLLAGFVIALLITLGETAVSLAWDASHPVLDWPNETYAIKQNNNVLITMLTGFVSVLLPGGLAAVTIVAGVSPALRLAAVTAVCLLMAAAGLFALRCSEKAYAVWEKGV